MLTLAQYVADDWAWLSLNEQFVNLLCTGMGPGLVIYFAGGAATDRSASGAYSPVSACVPHLLTQHVGWGHVLE